MRPLNQNKYKTIKIILFFKQLRLDSGSLVSQFMATESNVYHMEVDIYIPGNILYSEGSALKTTDGITAHLIAGSVYGSGYSEGVGPSARFGSFFRFLQLTDTLVLIADYYNHCVRSINRTNNQTDVYSGECTRRDHRDGVDALFAYPNALILDINKPGTILISEYTCALKSMSIVNRNVSTLGRSDFRNQLSILQDQNTGNIFLTFSHGIGLYDYQRKTYVTIAGSSTQGFADGTFSSTRFALPQNLIFLNNHTLLLADEQNNRLRILNLRSNMSSSICSGMQGHAEGDLASCQLFYPYALLIINSIIYVSDHKHIKMIQGKFHVLFIAKYTFYIHGGWGFLYMALSSISS